MKVIEVSNILSLEERKIQSEHNNVLDYLVEYHPDGFDTPYRIFVGTKQIEMYQFEDELEEGDVVYIFVAPAVTAAIIGGVGFWGWAAATAINLVIATAVSYAVGKIFAPDMPNGMDDAGQQSANKQSSVYNLNSNQNVTRLGQTIPVLYGRSRVYPSLIEQSYYFYRDNEMYLYQTMLVSAGKVDIDHVLIADSPEQDLAPADVIHNAFYDASFGAGDIKTTMDILTAHPDFRMRVKTLPDISGLELRGTPENNEMHVSFSGSTITFYRFANGEYPDISSLTSGSFIKISNSDSNNSTGNGYEVDSVNVIAHTVTVKSHTFTIEPQNKLVSRHVPPGTVTGLIAIDSMMGMHSGLAWKISLNGSDTVGTIDYVRDNEPLRLIDMPSCTTDVTVKAHHYAYVEIYETLNCHINSVNNGQLLRLSSTCTLEFETSYGSYTLNEKASELDSVEVDIEYPRGIYNSDNAGVFSDREITLEYNLMGNVDSGWLNLNDTPDSSWPADTTEQEKTNTPQRRTYKLPLPSGIDDSESLKIRLRRVSPEVADIKSQDMAIVQRVKAIFKEPDITEYGNMTLLVARIKASNAISSKGQFQINCWAERNEVGSDITSVITDIYVNGEYGGGLDVGDLNLPAMSQPNTIDPATDTGMINDSDNFSFEILGTINLTFNGVVEVIRPTAEVQTLVPFKDGDWWYVVDRVLVLTHGGVRKYKYYPAGAEFNGALDQQSPLIDQIKLIAAAGGYTPVLKGSIVELIKDNANPIRKALFNETNIIKDSLKLDYLFGENTDHDYIQVKYRSPDTFKELVERYPAYGDTPKSIELRGVTDAAVALERATYTYKSERARRKLVTFKTDVQGLIFNLFDRIAVAHTTINLGISGKVDAFSGTSVTLSCGGAVVPIPACGDVLPCDDVVQCDYTHIIFVDDKGQPTDALPFTVTSDGVIDVPNAPSWIYVGYEKDKTSYSLVTSTTTIDDYLILNTKNSENSVEISAINYDESIYV